MKFFLFTHLAADGIRRNGALYLPYCLMSSVMIMMFYILNYLQNAPWLDSVRGGNTIAPFLGFGVIVIVIFSVVLLFYANTFITRRRLREMGLYHVLGMGKADLIQLMLWENVFTTVASLAGGLLLGVVLSKAAEVFLQRLVKVSFDFSLMADHKVILQTLLVYVIVFIVLMGINFIRLAKSNPMELLKADKTGDKPPRGNALFALLGILILAGAYAIAISLKNPVDAALWFFVAVIMVIIATYLLFVSGSVVLCRILKKNKKYYYHPKHFVAVSQMVYRMKRNGAGLASICILATMVLVTTASTCSLYIGEEDCVRVQYPQEIKITARYNYSDYNIDTELLHTSLPKVREAADTYCPERTNGFEQFQTYSCITDGVFYIDSTHIEQAPKEDDRYLYFIPTETYNQMTEENRVLADDECMVLYQPNTGEERRIGTAFTISGGKPMQIKDTLPYTVIDKNIKNQYDGFIRVIMVVMNDVMDYLIPVYEANMQNGDNSSVLLYSYAFDMEGTDDEKLAVNNRIAQALYEKQEMLLGQDTDYDGSFYYTTRCRAEAASSFYTDYAILFFLGILLSIVFLVGAVLIIYYKQYSEGLEDRARFTIMQKVGMTDKEIRSTVNTQVFIVFLSPLLLAGVHLTFAFPFIWKILQVFNFFNLPLIIGTTVISFAVYGVFYGIVYNMTAKVYYHLIRR